MQMAPLRWEDDLGHAKPRHGEGNQRVDEADRLPDNAKRPHRANNHLGDAPQELQYD